MENTAKKPLDYAKQPATDALKTSSKSVIQKTAEATDDLVGIEIANRITYEVSKSSLQINSGTITNEHVKEIPKERYTSAEKISKIIDDLRLI